jgi:hypothetical protein
MPAAIIGGFTADGVFNSDFNSNSTDHPVLIFKKFTGVQNNRG